MKKEDFKQTLKDRLRNIDLKERQQWTDADLLIWWGEVQKKDSYLRWDRATGDLWQHVKIMCKDLIGKKAVC